MACDAKKCELRLTNILTNPIQPMIVAVPGQNPMPGLNDYPHQARNRAEAALLVAKIQRWAQPSTTTPCAQPAATIPGAGGTPIPVPFIPCICRPVETPDWTKAATLSDDFRHAFTMGNFRFEAQATIEYQLAYVAGICSEPQGVPKYLAQADVIDGTDFAILALGEREITAEMLAKIKGVLG